MALRDWGVILRYILQAYSCYCCYITIKLNVQPIFPNLEFCRYSIHSSGGLIVKLNLFTEIVPRKISWIFNFIGCY